MTNKLEEHIIEQFIYGKERLDSGMLETTQK
jgi:hypothetical protein